MLAIMSRSSSSCCIAWWARSGRSILSRPSNNPSMNPSNSCWRTSANRPRFSAVGSVGRRVRRNGSLRFWCRVKSFHSPLISASINSFKSSKLSKGGSSPPQSFPRIRKGATRLSGAAILPRKRARTSWKGTGQACFWSMSRAALSLWGLDLALVMTMSLAMTSATCQQPPSKKKERWVAGTTPTCESGAMAGLQEIARGIASVLQGSPAPEPLPVTFVGQSIEQAAELLRRIVGECRRPDFAGEMNGAVTAHSRSVKSDGYRNSSQLCSFQAIPVHPIASSIFSTKTAESQDTGIADKLSDQALRQCSLKMTLLAKGLHQAFRETGRGWDRDVKSFFSTR